MLVVFDLDGTLIDSVRDLAESTNEVVVSYGAEPLPPEAVAAMIGDGARKLVARALAARQLTAPVDEALERYFAIYDRRLLNHTRPYAGVVEAVRELSSRGPLAVLTNKPEAPARRLLEAFDMADRFGWIVGGDGPFPRKPDPRSLLHVMLEAAVSAEETVLVGDSAIDAETARRAGVRLCLARYGFGSARGPIPTDPHDLIVDDPGDLVRVVGQVFDRRS
ncbi:MAG TPA: HAD-IA family hydrolase [Vicinamibacterales bacterium]|nr:HAD-IA family hydrolase [Vicinamibacterales bacterium]